MNYLYYRKTYLSDGTKIKITHELHGQLDKWKQEQIEISDTILDELKMQSNTEINAERRYYRHNVSLNAELEKENTEAECNYGILDIEDKTTNVEQSVIDKDTNRQIISVLKQCTPKQRERFISHFYYDKSYVEIAQALACSEKAIRDSIKLAINQLFYEKMQYF